MSAAFLLEVVEAGWIGTTVAGEVDPDPVPVARSLVG